MQLFQAHPSLPAIMQQGKSLSYEELETKVLEASKALYLSGVRKGDRVAFIAEKTPETIIAFFALQALEASSLLLSTRLPEKQLKKLIEKAESNFFLHLPSFALSKKTSYPPKPQQILLFTSGTTKEPKLVCLTFEGMLLGAKLSLSRFKLTENSRWLLSVPLFHVSGLSILFRAISSGCAITFSLEEATHISFVEFQLKQLLEQRPSLPSLEFILVGGGPVRPSLIQSSPYPIHITYGMTETGAGVTMTDKNPLQGAGFPLPGRELSISEKGEVLVKGQMLFTGYDKSPSSFLPGGWFPTGDLGEISSEGALYLKGRKSQLIISGGENISPEEIERVLLLDPHILRAAVVPKKDPEYGERPVAFLETKGPFPQKLKLEEALQEYLPKFAVPIAFYPLPQKQKNKIKINKTDLLIEINS